MNESQSEEALGTLALYALDALSDTERRRVEERLASDWSELGSELDAYRAVAGRLGLAAPDAEVPSDRMKARLFEAIDSAGQQVPEGFSLLAALDGDWVEFLPGASVRVLSRDRDSGRSTTLIRLAAGTALPAHRHIGAEELYCIEGECRVAEDVLLGPGDFFRSEPGTLHYQTSTETGALILAISGGAEFVEA